jgi:hypothetical protein
MTLLVDIELVLTAGAVFIVFIVGIAREIARCLLPEDVEPENDEE